MKKFVLILFTIFLLHIQNEVFAANYNNSVNLIKEKNNIPHNVKIIKKDGLYGLINKDTKEILVPCQYGNIKRLGVDTIIAENVKYPHHKKILTNNNLKVLEDKNGFYKVGIEVIDKSKPSDVSNSVYYGIYNDSYPIFTRVTIPSKPAGKFFEQAFEQNNKVSWIKYVDYPKYGTIILKSGNKSGYLTTKNNDYWISVPEFYDVATYDNQSAIYRQFGITFSNELFVRKTFIDNYWERIENLFTHKFDSKSYGYKFFTLNSNVNEEISINDGNLYIKYKPEYNPYKNYYVSFSDNNSGYNHIVLGTFGGSSENIKTSGKSAKFRDLRKLTEQSENLEIAYKKVNSNSFIKFQNYPQNGILVVGNGDKKGLIIFNGDKKKTINPEYEDFYFPDEGSSIFKALNLSFSDCDCIIAKKNNKWGIIDKDNNIITNFQYNFITGVSANENIDLSYDNSGIYIKFKNIDFANKNMFLVKKDGLSGVIDKNGNYLIPLKEQYDKEKIAQLLPEQENKVLKNILKSTTKRFKKEDLTFSEMAYNTVAGLHGTFIVLPAWLLVGVWFWPFIMTLDGPVSNFLFNALI